MATDDLDEYRKTKSLVQLAAKAPDKQKEVARAIAEYYISQLRTLGVSDGALCALAALEGYESFKSELESLESNNQVRTLHERKWVLARRAGIAHESSVINGGSVKGRISSEPLRRAIASVVWVATRDFRARHEAQKSKPTVKEQQPLFYNEPADSSRDRADYRPNRWV